MTTQRTIRKSLKPCAEIGCNNLTRDTYCESHKKSAQKTHEIYNKYSRDRVTDSFYRSKAWRELRAVALDRDNHLCQRCKEQGTLTKADVVHHIIEVSEDWSLRLTLDNLESLCHACHNRHHKATPLY